MMNHLMVSGLNTFFLAKVLANRRSKSHLKLRGERPLSVEWERIKDGIHARSSIRGVPWSWNSEAVVRPGDLRVRFLTEEEKQSGTPAYGEEKGIHRLQLRLEDFPTHRFTRMPRLFGHSCWNFHRGHSERCGGRIEAAFRPSLGGQDRGFKQRERYNDETARETE